MSLEQTLHTMANRLRWRHIARTVIRAVGSLSFCFLLLGLANVCHPLTETLCAILGTIAIIAHILFIFKDMLVSSRQWSSRQLALDVEHAHPELMDSFICAVELEAKTTPLRPLEADLLQDIRQRLQTVPLLDDAFRVRLRLKPLILEGLLAVVLSVAAVHSPATVKWFHANRRPFTFQVMTEKEYPRHADVRLIASANRWEQDCWIETDQPGGTIARYPMQMTQEGAAFIFYDVNGPVRYRIGSPSLRSRWHSFAVYDPPEITSVTVTATPPAYTGKEATVLTELQDFSVIAGSVIDIRVETSTEAKKEIEAKIAAETFSLPSFALSDSDDLRLIATDADGHRQITPWFHVIVEPDLPPVLEQRMPTGDRKIKAYDYVRLDASASDDFGLTSFGLQFTKNGEERQVFVFERNNENSTVWEHNAMWDIPAMKLQDGDMLSCVFFAEDNRKPNSQITRGEVFFITVQPDEDEIDAQGMGEQQQKASVADLIAEAKRLLRLTWDTLSLAPQNRSRQTGEVLDGLNDLSLEIVRRENKLKEDMLKLVNANQPDNPPADDDNGQTGTHMNLPEPFNRLFANAVNAENTAVRHVQNDILEESAVPQERALTFLVKIENELLRNEMKSKKGEGKDGKKGEEDKRQKQQNQQSEDKQTAEQRQDRAKQLQEAAETLRQQILRQEAINLNASEKNSVLEGLAEKQSQLGTDTAALEKTLRPLAEAAEAREAIAQAAAEMKDGAEAFKQRNANTASIHGNRAHAAQLEALRSLEDAIEATSSSQLSELTERAADLSRRQNDAARESDALEKQPDTDALKALRERQKGLKDETAQLRQSLQDAAGQLQERHADVAKDIRDAVKNMDSRQVLGAQQRAVNALLYKRPDRAKKEQRDASNQLAALAAELATAAEKLPKMTAQELRDAIDKIQRQAQETAQAMNNEGQQAEDRLNQIREQASRHLDKLGDKLKDSKINQLSDNLNVPFDGQTPSDAGQFLLRQLQTASQLLVEQLQKMTMEKKRELSRSQLAPPRKYRRLVEDYFKQVTK